ncbi:CHAD domain-containing protein [Solicola sp. PLA-1-18]|uniref:CYTH and CHAD domain-containing protein n=1 Tax=Solicola sp. PLA-1-18 TaxID=3380532 RepID=UPI003B78DAA0
MTVLHEVERTYDVDETTAVPPLVGGLVADVGPSVTTELTTAYLDTETYALARAGVSLRRRLGGDDAGWHLKLAVDTDSRTELQRPAGRTRRVPAPLARLVAGLTAGAPLVGVADLRTTRTTRRLLGADGEVLAVVCDDTVVVDLPGGDTHPGWREIEVELVDGGPDVLDDVEASLAVAGIVRSTSSSKIRRALGVPDEPAPPSSGLRRRTAGAHLHAYLLEHRDVLVRADLGHRVAGESVHDVRVASRRLRAALTVYRPLLDEDRARHLQAELRWLGQELGDLRDVEVARKSVVAALDAEPDALATGPARLLAREHLDDAEATARDRARRALDSRRHAALLAGLEQLLVDPPWTSLARRRAADELGRLCRKPRRRLRRAVRDAGRVLTQAEHEEALHHVRKSAKRLRYALEVLLPAEPGVRRVVRRSKGLQTVLGDHLDARRAGRWFRHLGHAGTADAAFVLGRVHARTESDDTRVERDFHRAARRLLTDKRLRRL